MFITKFISMNAAEICKTERWSIYIYTNPPLSKEFLKNVKIQNINHFEIALMTLSTSFKGEDKWICKLGTLYLQKNIACNDMKEGTLVTTPPPPINQIWPYFIPEKGNFGPPFTLFQSNLKNNPINRTIDYQFNQINQFWPFLPQKRVFLAAHLLNFSQIWKTTT